MHHASCMMNFHFPMRSRALSSCKRIWTRKHLLASFPASISFRFCSSSSAEPPCDIVSGPSLLRTAVHRPRPSLLYLPGLRSLPFWTQQSQNPSESNASSETPTRVAYNDPQVTHAVQHLEANVDTIRKEYLKNFDTMKSDYETDTEHTLHRGQWDWHSYMTKGSLQGHFGQHYPETTAILQGLRDAKVLFEGVPFGYTFYSTLHPKSSIDAHAAPMNFRLRVHLPLIVPADPSPSSTSSSSSTLDPDAGTNQPLCGIRVGPVTRSWQTDKALVLDDAYNHQVWNETDEKRVILLVDLWHPDVTMSEREDIVAMFQHAKKQGWWTES